jgi:hypothetical protein
VRHYVIYCHILLPLSTASVCPQPSERTPKGGTPLLPVRATPGHLNHFATLVFQQRGQQSALRKGESRFFFS